MWYDMIPAFFMVVVFVMFCLMRHFETKCSEKSFEIKDLDENRKDSSNYSKWYLMSTMVFLWTNLVFVVVTFAIICFEIYGNMNKC